MTTVPKVAAATALQTLIMLSSAVAFAEEINIPADHPTIQAGIAAGESGR